MTYVADLHLHSPYSRGASKQLTLENMARWAKIKGIDLLAAADFTHPQRFEETKSKLSEAGNGLFECGGTRFVLGTEINCSGQQGGKNRRVHLLVLAPGFETVALINSAVASRGLLGGNGRPTLHLTARELVRVLLDIDSRCVIIPAHLWTPWFGLYGSKSGYDSLGECFGDVAGHIHAVETGLSSDPAMNWRIPSLDSVSLVSFSDAHSLPNIGRELTVFPGEPSYDGLVDCLRRQRISYTVEFFPQEGKYHHSGHRKCGVRFTPAEVMRMGQRCPRCGGRLTLGVMQRVEELAGREVDTWVDDEGYTRADNGRPPFKTLVSLRQIISESLGCGPNTKKTWDAYFELVSQLGSELSVLTRASPCEIATLSGERVAQGVARVRSGDISIEPGYDGKYGSVRIWPD